MFVAKVAFGALGVPEATFAASGAAGHGGYPSPVHWMFTGLLVGASGVTAVYTLWLVRRLFTTPVPPPLRDDAETAP